MVAAVSTGQVTVTQATNSAWSSGVTVKELAFEIFLALEFANTQTTLGTLPGFWFYAKGLRVTFANQWDWQAHFYTGGYQTSFICYEVHNTTMVFRRVLFRSWI